ncbi:hypothetical protein ACFLQY_01025 [Verrucomicrobiota bacterium]
MTLSDAARERLTGLLPAGSVGFEVQGYLGTCSGSTPVLRPVGQTPSGEEIIQAGGLLFFVKPDMADLIRDCTFDYDPSFFGKGLTMTWTHRNGCACHQ